MALTLAIIAVLWFALGLGCSLIVGAVIRHAQSAYDALDNSADETGAGKELNATHGGDQ